MKAIILAGGFAKRMWPLTLEVPKPLLTVGGRPMIEHVMDKVLGIPEVDRIFITTNRKFEMPFREWLNSREFPKQVSLVIEDASSESEKLGSVGAVDSIIRNEEIDDDILCIAGDNLLDCSLDSFMQSYRSSSRLVFGLCEMNEGDLTKYGIAQLDVSGRVVGFEEKPSNPRSNLVATAIYAIPRDNIRFIHEYMGTENNPDAFGHFISWLHRKSPVYGYVFREKWFDIGSFEMLEAANSYIASKT